MSKIIKANLLNFFEEYEGDISIGHCVNCQGVMGAGIAKEIKRRYPIAFSNYKLACERGTRGHLGKISRHIANSGNHFKIIFNLHGQEFYGRGKKYLMESELLNALRIMDSQTEGTVAFPYMMGCGLAGGDWDIVSFMIEEVFEGREIIYCKL